MKLGLRFFLLIGFLVYVLFFIGFNLGKTMDVSVVVWTFQEAPTFFVLMTTFILGALFPVPFLLGKKKTPPSAASAPATPEKAHEKPVSKKK